ncbi:response regulator [Cyanobacteria bacterium FACHB-63]|nr:response regulator [Cyanobacteria bacterium FACHB-63]
MTVFDKRKAIIRISKLVLGRLLILRNTRNKAVLERKGRRILAVDDTADNLLLLQVFLEAEGFEVEVADCGSAALNRFQLCNPDLVLLDVMMPGMNGLEVTQEIRSNDHTTPILLISAHDKVQVQPGLDAGANGYIQKPIDLSQLLSRIEALTA